ncbi:threonylcarbamoyl-AMP synthase [Georgenia sp. EYE_87]|uniref:L-threonylcarbamoyladenylate synthase n=1 Tax=Georgenia sp. EYE_87 TaxID=2853448 RepID=UPI002003A06A|nr:L-threonylcarbamoyladenylate synthase [Georgenia sp. EYE_87]MCK6209231.1 threonylcarbamoyl-AMP synthase [Georgenia sp. EYE_87]
MARYLEIHPQDPQPRLVAQAVEVVRRGGLIAYPTDSGYAVGCALGNKDGLDRIKLMRRLDDKHHFTLVCRDFAQLGQFVIVDNAVFRLIKSATPGPYTFILRGTQEVPRRLLHPKKHTVGVRIPDHRTTQALLAELGEPLLSSTLIMPGQETPMTEGWMVKEELEGLLDVIVDSDVDSAEPTTVVDLTSGAPEVLRTGAGDPSRFE